MKVAAFTSGVDVPSSRFRLRPFITPLALRGIAVSEHVPRVGPYPSIAPRLPCPRAVLRPAYWASAGACRVATICGAEPYDVAWVERTLWRGGEFLQRLLRAPYVLDVDDAIWLSRPQGVFGAEYLARNASAVVAGNAYLSNWAAQWCQRVHVIPTAVDCSFEPEPLIPDSEKFVVGWIGTSANLKYLESIEDSLAEFFEKSPGSVLHVMADKPPRFAGTLSGFLKYFQWSELGERSFFERLHVGLMPLEDSPWERGKCSFKMLQYMSHARPVVVSKVGMNVDVLSYGGFGFGIDGTGGWSEALSALYLDRQMLVEMGLRGRDVVCEHYATSVIVDQIANVMSDVK